MSTSDGCLPFLICNGGTRSLPEGHYLLRRTFSQSKLMARLQSR